MKLQDLESSSKQKTKKVFESYFEKKIDLSAIDQSQALKMLAKLRAAIAEHRNSSNIHNSEHNPSYLKAVFMEQALEAVLAEGMADVVMKDPKTKQIMQKAARGQNLTPDEQKVVTAIAMAPKQEAKKKKNANKVMESEVQQAQVVLAAQDMVDRMQGMLEDVTEMKFKDLPALVDSIRNEVGMNEAQSYSADAGAALDTLIACLQETKTAVEGAQGVLTGQEPIVPGEEEMDMDVEVDTDDGDVADVEVDTEEPQSDLEASLGRARR